jgi:hypothetical protein
VAGVGRSSSSECNTYLSLDSRSTMGTRQNVSHLIFILLNIAMQANGIAPSPRPCKRRRTRPNSDADTASQHPSEAQDRSDASEPYGQHPQAISPKTGVAGNGPSLSQNAPAGDSRSCENCRRGKLKCSRSYPCANCARKGSNCIYGQDKRRGPPPGYIEDLCRRMDMLEQMVLGQALMWDRGKRLADGLDFKEAVEHGRERLRDASHAQLQGATKIEVLQPSPYSNHRSTAARR